MENSRIIILRSVYKVTKCYMEPAINPATGRYNSNVRRVDSNGNQLNTEEDRKTGAITIAENEMIEIFDGKSFDLDDPYDNAWWEAIKFSKRIAQDRWARDKKGALIIDGDTTRYGSAEFYVEKPGQETKIKNTKRREVHEAKAYVYDDSADGLYQKAKLLGNPMSGLPISDVEDYLIALAETKPEKIKELYTGSDTHLRMLLLDAIDQRVVNYRDKLYIYGEDIMLGATQDFVIHWFKDPKNKRLVEGIKRETYPDLYENESQADLAAEAEAPEPTPQIKPSGARKPVGK